MASPARAAGMDLEMGTFSDLEFSAPAAASKFFAEHTDAEVQRKLNELANLQVFIEHFVTKLEFKFVFQNYTEAILRQTVAENYGAFVHANSEIRSLGSEMLEVKDLISDTLKIIQVLFTPLSCMLCFTFIRK